MVEERDDEKNQYSKIAIELVDNFIKLNHTLIVKFTEEQKILITKISDWANKLTQ